MLILKNFFYLSTLTEKNDFFELKLRNYDYYFLNKSKKFTSNYRSKKKIVEYF